jgi:subtilisin-like proprotein convertase family protein
MKTNYLFFLFFVSIFGFAQTQEDAQRIILNYDVNKIKEKSEFYKTLEAQQKAKAIEKAKVMKWPTTLRKSNGKIEELIGLTPDGYPLFLSTDNDKAAKSTRTNFLYSGGVLGLNLTGQNMVARVWDGGKVRTTHNILTGRITVVDDPAGTLYNDHSTHVTGTVMASDLVAATKGMAFQATGRTFNWTNDESEVLDEVLGGMLISNHSYGVPLINSTTGKQLPEWYVGSYSQDAQAWDEIAFLSPYYLMVTSAGNSGGDTNTGASTPGYDKMNGNKLAKNNLSVGNAQDASVNQTTGNLNISPSINTSSSQGPADDGRIKPDIVGNGTGLTSCIGTSDSATASYTGTSMASPNVAGTLLLLQQHSKNLTNNFMKASTLKGLATHTADDSGNPGPDAIFGWGLLNAKRCAETMNENGLKSWISEEVINQGQTYTMNVTSDGTNPLIASITWTDVPGTPNLNTTLVNNPLPALVNDLDIRITNGSNTYYPWRLQSNASLNATRSGDNNVDNVENIKIDTPPAGVYTITVTHKGNLVGEKQNYSMIVTGVTSNFAITSTSSDLIICNNQNANFSFNYKQTGSGTTNFTAEGLPAGATAVFDNNSLSANGSVSMTISNLNGVAPGLYNIGIKGTSSTETETRYRTLRVYNPNLQPTSLVYPINLQDDMAATTEMSWDKDLNAENYKIEVSTDNSFSNIIFTEANLITNAKKVYNLTPNTQYFWRIIPSNRCGSGVIANAAVKSFKTGNIVCNNNIFSATDFSNAVIADTADAEASVPITVTGGLKISDINVNLKINHTYVQDMLVLLIGPTSIGSPQVYLLSNTCGMFADVDAIFDDSGATVTCGDTPPSISGTIKPFGELSDFNNLLADGVWTLKVTDPYQGDGGKIISASISICNVLPATLSISDFELNDVTVFPNPSNGYLYINLNNQLDSKTKLILNDAQGRSILNKQMNGFNETLNLSNYQNGVYFLSIINGSKQTTKKIILNE